VTFQEKLRGQGIALGFDTYRFPLSKEEVACFCFLRGTAIQASITQRTYSFQKAHKPKFLYRRRHISAQKSQPGHNSSWSSTRTMATATLDETTIYFLSQSFSDLAIEPTNDASKVSTSLFPETNYTDAEKGEIDQWVITSSHIGSSSEDAAKYAERLSSLNRHLSTRTTILGSKPSVADVTLYSRLAPVVSKWSAEERTGQQGYHHIVRHLDFVEKSPIFHLKLDEARKIKIDPNDVRFVIKPVDAKAEKERKKREKEAAAAASAAPGSSTAPTVSEPAEAAGGQKSKKDKVKDKLESVAAAVGVEVPGANADKQQKKKEKKEKAPKPAKAAPVEKPLSPAQIDLRVGHILKAIQHPNADSLYVSTIAVGDAPGTDNTSEYEGQVVRTVCSGLNGLIPLEEMQGRKIIAVCNLKPVTMRGIKSAAMVLAASPRVAEGEDSHKGPVELVNPPEGAVAGERVYFEGWEGEPEPVLNPKKKVWELCQPGFTTTDALEVGFEVAAVPQLSEAGQTGVGKLRTKGGLCSVKTLKGATVR
jgi:aminoacyl tRNA synthase complex-interacting multifunctional protein 1